MPTIRVGIAGATGYAGEELIRLLLHHPHVQLAYLAASAKWERSRSASVVFPKFARQLDLAIEAFDPARAAAACDCLFLALPHGTAMSVAPALVASGTRVVDLSGDFRLHDPALYPRWYQCTHPHPDWLTRSGEVNGLTEFHRADIAKAQLVANPGCYATSILLGCVPLVRDGLIEDGRLIVDAKSGLSGAGRKADESLLFTEMTENLRAYKVNAHPHMPEVTQELAQLTGRVSTLMFVPQVIPASRGLIAMIHLRTTASSEAVAAAFAKAYPASTAPFVRVRPGTLPQLKDVVGTNYCDVGWVCHPELESLVVASALDNLVKGAAGQAVQNFNLMYGLPETTALL